MSPNTSSLRRPERIDALLLFRLSKIVSLGGSIVTRLCEGGYGITRREWAVLAILVTQDRLSWTEVAQRAELDDARLSRAVSSLVAKGLAQKTSDPNRHVHLASTERGQDLYAEIFPFTQAIHTQLLENLDDTSVKALDHALSVVHAQAERLARESALPKADRRLGRGRSPTS
ncbi:homoprotocatechuate degradation operon regulator, HpaR [Variovorax sp. PBS-H4]|uniref:MarR family winged helix-turn-helix transcriptional regulator n=1 Tax=Variovorax sp. PBS-H4 TaxID=434008 RepID=UPI001316B73A|nr:MarR family transcriptional regulator [Variovorax sp. PBS-H4]VTU39176.1 homoprotocatechuate degradation operon regulator, HpaR [Variovorax sp. PBS-H4]